jgi:hypothetical protein
MDSKWPNFLVIGAPKCGTTTLCDRLGSHEDVFMATPKEPHFFGHPEAYKTWEWYTSLFEGVDGESAIGEGSTSYTRPDLAIEAARAIRARIPACRLIYIVRDPIRRLESDWRMRVHLGWQSNSVSSAVKEAFATEDVILTSKEDNPELWWKRLLLTQGLYHRNLGEYRRLFPAEQILVLFLEELAASPDAELARCLGHIQVDVSLQPTGRKALNRAKDTRRDGRVASLLRQSPVFSEIKARLPRWLRSMGRQALTRPDAREIEWEPEVLERVVRYYRQDSSDFLEDCRKPADFWSVAKLSE